MRASAPREACRSPSEQNGFALSTRLRQKNQGARTKSSGRSPSPTCAGVPEGPTRRALLDQGCDETLDVVGDHEDESEQRSARALRRRTSSANLVRIVANAPAIRTTVATRGSAKHAFLTCQQATRFAFVFAHFRFGKPQTANRKPETRLLC